MSGLLGRVGAIFFEAAETAAPAPPAPVPAPAAIHVRAAVLGAPAAAVPLAAALAGELRARAGAAAALACIWRLTDADDEPAPEPDAPTARTPAGATTPGARRLAACLAADGHAATACGRLGWLALDPEPTAAAAQFGRCARIAGVPLVLAVAGPRPAQLEPLLQGIDLCVAVLPADVDPELRVLAVATLPGRVNAVVAPLSPGPPRWAAMAGLARLRTLPEVPE